MKIKSLLRHWRASIIVLAGAILLLWNLDQRYLWQDEANTAVLATRMLRFGKPLVYDGRNLVGIDDFGVEMQEPIDLRTGSAQAVVDYYRRKSFIRQDGSWKWHPWGQFVVAAASIRLLGQTTLAARLPFALAGILTVLLLYRLALLVCGSEAIAQLAAALLILNPYWILHARQSRYYALSSFFLVATLYCYARWQKGQKWSAAWFVAAAWCWFQVDYGTVLPVMLVLFGTAFAAVRSPARAVSTAATGVVWLTTIAPFIWFYELWGRAGARATRWQDNFQLNLFNLNEYLIPFLLLGAAGLLLGWRWRHLGQIERHILAVCGAIIAALAIWVPGVTVFPFLRYTIMAAPVGCLIAAWFLVRVAGPKLWWTAWPAAAIVAVTPWLSMPVHALIDPPQFYSSAPIVRSEFSRLASEVFGHAPDVNRDVIEWLRESAKPSDEILINYEDMPLVYYLPNPIRGGIADFRVEDDAVGPPRFLVARPFVNFIYTPALRREVERYRWQPGAANIPSALWGNNPDPMSAASGAPQAPVLTGIRVER